MRIKTIGSDDDRTAIAVLRIEIRTGNDEDDMRALAARLGYRLVGGLIALAPDREGPLTTVMLALARTKASIVIVPNIEHLDGIAAHIQQRARIVTVAGEHALERITTTSVTEPTANI
ncbi:hypothetical protein [Nocardia veterana]|uniref:Uncharacterized protein n=1 Tax=Nocardia veterana TaxID=132249 RepID=A0A7X6M400_9NOCA|nr:hypothetical protein [Nocardia veterana]NKY89777.1 hypothetical protein [Nocardia veterana]